MRLFARLSLRCAALFGALLFLMVPASACRTGETETPEETGGPDAPAIQTRQEFYYEVYRKILNDEILRVSICLPARVPAPPICFAEKTFTSRAHIATACTRAKENRLHE